MNLDPSNLPAELRDPLLNLNVHEDADAPEEMRGERRADVRVRLWFNSDKS